MVTKREQLLLDYIKAKELCTFLEDDFTDSYSHNMSLNTAKYQLIKYYDKLPEDLKESLKI